ncbi:MAG: hypothetical protein M1827_001562 [Pycnora praestabilis]|nr:MAG: hypothetical protein M1827_001562 [Pycnora praestabilis]
MTIKTFYLVGGDPSTSHEIDLADIPDLPNLTALQAVVAAHYVIVEPSAGVGFQNDRSGALLTWDAISNSQTSIGVTVDGHPIRPPLGPTGLPLLGSFYEVYPDHLGNHARLFAKYGSVIKVVAMGRVTYLTNSPEVAAVALAESPFFTKRINSDHPLFGVKDNSAIFLGDTETEAWHLAHKFIPPALSPKAVRHYTPLMQKAVRGSFPVFDELDARGEAWNVYQYMLKLGSQTIGEFALNMDLHHFDSPDAPLHPLVTGVATWLSLNKKITSRGAWYSHIPFGDSQRLKNTRESLNVMIQEAIDNISVGTGDLPLQDAALTASCLVDYLVRAADNSGKKLPHDLVLSNMIVMTGAGFTTTSSLLSWLIYCLVEYPGNQERLLQELVDYGVDGDTTWTSELANTLPFLQNFVKETQRLHNPAFQPGRTAKQDVILPGGYSLPADAVIISAIHAIHNNPAVWDNPHRFDPDRWDTSEVKQRHRAAYIPFATGQRGCIGFNFALQEVKILIAELVYRYQFTKEGNEVVDYDPEFQLIRPLNFYVQARKREDWPAPSIKGNGVA